MAIQHQPLKISLRQMVDNPTGKGSGNVAARFRIRQSMSAVYINVLQKYRKQFYAVPYLYQDGRILFHVKVPSEAYNINKISYDVLIEFENKPGSRLALRNAKFFSNSPSFIFTYAYVFNQKDILVDAFKNKLPSLCLSQPPVVRNPVESLGFEKSIYIAGRYLLDSFALSESYIKRFGKKGNSLSEIDLARRIANPDTLIAVYQHAKYLQAKTHRKPLPANEKRRRDDVNRRFAETQNRHRPEGRRGIFGIHIAPRPNITATKAQKTMNASIKNRKPNIKNKKNRK